MSRKENRAQAFTLEGFFAAIIILSSIVFALSVTAITPLTSSTASEHIRSQQRASASGFLAGASERGAVVPSLLYWNQSVDCSQFDARGTFQSVNQSGRCSYSGYIPSVTTQHSQLGVMMNNTYNSGVAVDVTLEYYIRDGDNCELTSRELPMVDMGSPSNDAATAERQVALYDDMHLYERGNIGDQRLEQNVSVTLDDIDGNETPADREFYAPDIAPEEDEEGDTYKCNPPSSNLYNIVTVKVTVWKT